MPQSRMVWLSMRADRNDLVVRVNDVPCAHMGASGGRNMPVNEFLHMGANSVEVRMPPTYDPLGPEPPGDGNLRLDVVEQTYDGERLVNEVERLSLPVAYARASVAPGGVLAAASFQSGVDGGPRLAGYAPIGSAERALVAQAMAQTADWWREGRTAELQAWMDAYAAEYAAAYPNETADGYRAELAQHIARHVRGAVRFDKAALVLDPCGEGRLLDVYDRRGGAGVAVTPLDAQEPEEMWSVCGVRDGRVVLVR